MSANKLTTPRHTIKRSAEALEVVMRFPCRIIACEMHYPHFMLRSIAALLLITPAFASSLQLLVLGSGGPRPFGRAGSSYIVIVDGTPRILIDAGPGAFLRIGELKVDLEKVDTILLTHLHIDHSGDLAGFFKARTLTASASSIRFAVFGPDGAG